MTSIPHKFVVKEFNSITKCEIPPMGQYAYGNIFFHPETALLDESKETFTKLAESLGLRVLGWREVPRDSSILGPAALSREPIILQPVVVLTRAYGDGEKPEFSDRDSFDEKYFERQLYVLRKQSTHRLGLEKWFYICSLSNKNIVYKGQLAPVQVYNYYLDLCNSDYQGHFALVHSRFSTNTFPSWDRAQPMRLAAHNGEINTLRGNKNWMRAREGLLASKLFGDELELLYPIIEEGGSDSAAFDNCLELLVINGVLTLPEAVMLMVPEAWQDNSHMDDDKKAFYEWAACMMEPWDGPALFTFADGRYCGANLDRNGLRPCRFYVTTDDIMICASEVGTILIEPEKIIQKGRLQPGKMLLVDTVEGRIVDDKELKHKTASRCDFGSWVQNQILSLPKIYKKLQDQNVQLSAEIDSSKISEDRRLLAFGYSLEQLNLLVGPMAADGKEALGSMGNDGPLACLAGQPRLMYDYFRQLFAQVTNPPIDPIRESIVMSLQCYVGPQGNLLEMNAKQCARLQLPSPVLKMEELEAIRQMTTINASWKSKTLDLTFEKSEGAAGYKTHLDQICQQTEQAIADGYKVVILSDRSTSITRVPLSALVATGSVHHHLVKNKLRSRVALMVETAEAREVHHMCVLLGYGADAICPWLTFEAIMKLSRENAIKGDVSAEKGIANWKKACDSGILKVMSKMGISTLQSYKGAQIFEALGIDPSVIDVAFVGTASRIKGVTFDWIAHDAIAFHEKGYPSRDTVQIDGLPESGEYHWRDGGDPHINDPTSIANLQDAVRSKNDQSYAKYSKAAYDQIKNCTLRGLLDFDYESSRAIPVEQVEPWTEIVRRFCTGAMSYGSISMESHSALAIAMNRLGGKSNTGEGGEDPERSMKLANGDTMRSAIKQVASGRFGVTSYYLSDADELQIKMAQGAKPGEGGELPGHKVSQSIARTRHSTPGVGLISPPPHHDIYSIEDLKQLIYDLKCSNPRARVSVKLVSEVGVGIVASGVAKAKADHILISGHDGGTGASRWTGIKYAGLPWELGLAETHQTLVLNDLRGRVCVQTDGQVRTGRDVAVAMLLGAEEIGFATTPLIAMGCIMMRKCFAPSTVVRTTKGEKPISEIQIGDYLLDSRNLPVLCTAVDDVQQGPMKRISYEDYDSHQTVSFDCTPDHILMLVAACTKPSLSVNEAKQVYTVTWFSRCNRIKAVPDAIDLNADIFSDYFYRDLVDSCDELPSSEEVHKQLDVFMDTHYHQGHHDGSARLDVFLERLATAELADCPELVVEQAHKSMTRYLEHHATLTPIDTPEDMQLSGNKDSVSPMDERVVWDLGDISQLRSDQMSDCLDTSAINASAVTWDKLTCLKSAVNTHQCTCNGFGKVTRRFASAEQANFVRNLLMSDKHHVIDDFVVSDGEIFEPTVTEFEAYCNKEVARMNMQTYRVPLEFKDFGMSSGDKSQSTLPLDPYFLGLWLGDGSVGAPVVSSADVETRAWLQQYVNSLNEGRPAGTRPLKVTIKLSLKAGEFNAALGYHNQVDTYTYTISCVDTTEASGDWWNPVTSGLQQLALFDDKSGGVPRTYMDADLESRLALLAGLVESDGCYVKSHNTYRFAQTEEHKQIVLDVVKLANSCGISTTSVDIGRPLNKSTKYVCYLGKGSDQFQRHLTVPRKRMQTTMTHESYNTRPIRSVESIVSGDFRGIQVSGGEFQLANRSVVHNCHLNTCPVGIATQDPELRKKFMGQPEHVINFFYYVVEELRGIMAKLGFRTVDEMVGRTDKLKVNEALRTPKTKNLDLSPILTPAFTLRPGAATYNVRKQDHRLYTRLDNKLIDEAEWTLERGLPSQIDCQIINTDRALGATLSNRISKKFGENGLPDDSIHVNLYGSAGQSFGCFLAPGVTLELEGDANDYVGKGLSGGRIMVYPPKNSIFNSEENVIVGNVCLYGATSGKAYFRGMAAERFAVRNSGAHAVVEGVGDHGCEYMTGGRVVILGATGRNFAAGMSGGIAYVLDMGQDFASKVNPELVELSKVTDPVEIAFLRGMLEDHRSYTGSEVADRILNQFHRTLDRFVKVLPVDYKRVLEEDAKKAAEAKKTAYQVDIVKPQEKPKANGHKEPAVLDLEDAVVDENNERRKQPVDKIRGFMKYSRKAEKYRNALKRTNDWDELSSRLTVDELKLQTARCMDCGVPFCQSDSGCPISNIIPKWNELVFNEQWQDALDRLLMTNNFPEFTGRVCPAPCEGACVLGINEAPVGIKSIECAIIDKGFEMGWMQPKPPKTRTGKTVAIVGSGPAGLSAADQLNKAGHLVTVYERADRIGGLLMYGIPNMKLDKKVVQRRVDLMAAEGITFVTGTTIGEDVTVAELQEKFDSVLLSTGATVPRDMTIPGRNVDGIIFAMQFLHKNTKSLLDSGLADDAYISAKGKDVIVIGGGDTGNDCLGTSVRHGAKSVLNFELLPQPPATRAKDNPWPQFPRVFKVDYGHSEVQAHYGKDPREYCIMSNSFVIDEENNKVKGIQTTRVEWTKNEKGQWSMAKVAGSEAFFPADLIILAMGFLGPEEKLISDLPLKKDPRSNFATPAGSYKTSVDKIYACGDCRRGQSLVVWAINEGRSAAIEMDKALSGNSRLPVIGGIILSN